MRGGAWVRGLQAGSDTPAALALGQGTLSLQASVSSPVLWGQYPAPRLGARLGGQGGEEHSGRAPTT